MSRPTKTQAILRFLQAKTHKDLSSLYNLNMEVQVLVSQENGTRIDGDYKGKHWHGWTDGVQTWKPFRIPLKANTEPEYEDREINFDLDRYVEAIGMTGWDWKERLSRWVAFDFDGITGHSEQHAKRLTEAELEEIKNKILSIPWCSLRKSTGGKGYHIYVALEPVETKNHTEHAALARAILGMMSGAAQFDLAGKVDVCGGNMWVWHRKMTDSNEGLKILKPQEFLLKEIPLNWRDHLDVISGSRRKIMPSFIGSPDQSTFEALIGKSVKVALDEQHTKLLEWFKNNNYRSWWDNDHWMLVCHTYHLKLAHAALQMRGVFETMSTGAEAPFDHNCFCFPQINGAWSVRRYAPGVAEAKTWEQDGVGFTKCLLNKIPSLKIASRIFSGVEMTNGSYSFSAAKDAVLAAELLGTKIELPEWINLRAATLKEHKDGRLVVSISQAEDDVRHLTGDSNLKGWAVEKKHYVKVLDHIQKSETEYDFGTFDEQVRHLVSAAAGEDCGWVMKTSDSEWRTEPLTHIKAYLASQGFSAKDITGILGASIGRCWYLVNKPFQEEYPSGREWNKNAAKFKFLPTQETDNLSYPTWLKILNHCGSNLDKIVKTNEYCIQSGILTGGDYLKCWVASVFQQPTEPLPYLFFFSKAQNTGKSIFHEALSLLMTRGVVKADNALQSPTFNGELAGAVICVVEETDLGKNKQAYNKLKEWVTAKEISIRALYEAPYMSINTTHWVHCANDHLACPIFPGDSRITFVNVPPLNPMELIPKKLLLSLLIKEAPDFLRAVLSLELPQLVDRLSLPILSTYEKTIAAQANRSLLEEFIDDNVFYEAGSMVKFSDFFEKFKLWLDPQDLRLWSKIRVGRELPSQHPKGRVMKEDGQFYIGNMSFDQPKLIKSIKPLIVINDKLTEEL